MAKSVDKLKLTEAAQLVGFEFDEYGAIGIPRGPRDLGTIVSGTKCLSAGIFDRGPFRSTFDVPALFVHLDDGSIRYSTNWSSGAGPATWTSLLTSQGTTTPASFCQFLGEFWILAYNVNLHKVSTALAVTTYAGAPKGYCLVAWRDALWQANIPSVAQDRVVSSAPGDGSTWPALSFVDVGKGEEGMGIFGLLPTEQALAVFKKDRTHIIFDPVEFTNRMIDGSKGAIGKDAFVKHDGRVFFLSTAGICEYRGDSPHDIVSEKLNPLFNQGGTAKYGTSLATGLLALDTDSGSGYSFGDHVGFHIPNNVVSPYVKLYPGMSDVPIVFGVPAAAANTDDELRFLSWQDMEVPSGSGVIATQHRTRQLYEISGSPAKLWRHYDVAGASPIPVAGEWDTGWQDFERPLSEKWLSRIHVLHRGPIDVYVRSDYDRDAAIQVASGLSHGEPEFQESTIFCDVYGRAFQISVRGSTAGELKQQIASGHSSIGEISRFQVGVAGMTLHAQQLSDHRV